MAGKIRITGMNSGLDTDSMVRELVNAYEKQGEKYTKKKTTTEWKQEAWNTLNTKIKNFFSKSVNNMRFSTAYSKKKTTVSDPSKASVITSSGAVNGSQTLKVTSLAKTAYLTGADLGKTDKSGNAITKNTTLADLGYTGGETTIKIGKGAQNSDGSFDSYVTPDIKVSGSTTLEEFSKQVSAAGYNANFDESTGRFFISSKESGEVNNFSFVADTFDGGRALANLGLQSKDYYSELGGLQGNSLVARAKQVADERGVEYNDDILNEFRGYRDEAKNAVKNENYAYKINGEDAAIELNGAKFKSATNTFSINGLTITAKDVTSEAVSIVTDTDYDEIYDNVKNFLKEYNSIVNEMDKLYNAKSSSVIASFSSDVSGS